MSSTKNKLRLGGAFAALTALALAVSCTGFFQNPTVSSITIDPLTRQWVWEWSCLTATHGCGHFQRREQQYFKGWDQLHWQHGLLVEF